MAGEISAGSPSLTMYKDGTSLGTGHVQQSMGYVKEAPYSQEGRVF